MMYIVTTSHGLICSRVSACKLDIGLIVFAFNDWCILKETSRWGQYCLVGRCATYMGV